MLRNLRQVRDQTLANHFFYFSEKIYLSALLGFQTSSLKQLMDGRDENSLAGPQRFEVDPDTTFTLMPIQTLIKITNYK